MVALATRVYVRGDARQRALRSLRSLVDNALADLDVEWSLSVGEDDFPEVDLDGPDAVAAGNLLREEWGEIPAPETGSEAAVGTLESWDDEGFVLDAGRPVRIPADELGLGPGTPADVVERFGLVQHLRMRFVPGGGTANGPDAAAGPDDPASPRLADAERDRLYDWRRGPGRVNVNSATRAEVRATVNRAGHARDVVTVERLGLLEQSIVCREDTDPPGLLAAVGDYLPAEMRCVIP